MSATIPTNIVSSNGIGVVPDALLNTFIQSGGLLANARAFNNALTGMTIGLLGLNSPQDGGQGDFWWNPASTATDDGGLTVIQPNGLVFGRWLRLNGGTLQIQSVPNIATLRALATGISPIYVQGYYAPGDGGGGMYSIGAAGSDNGGTIIVSSNGTYYLERNTGPVSIRIFGAKIDGSSDDGPSWRNALLATTAQMFEIFHPGGLSVVVGTLALKSQIIIGTGSYYAPPGEAITQNSMIEFHGNNAGLILLDANSGGVTIEKIGFQGVPGTYTGQVGFFMDDALRPGGQNEGWPTLRDVLFAHFDYGMIVGNKYQGGWMFNVYFYNSGIIGYWQQSTDWYHYSISCGSGSRIASTAQLFIGTTAGVFPSFACGNHQFIGGAFFGATNTVIIGNTNANELIGAVIQNGQNNGVLIGNGLFSADNTKLTSCYLNGNNASGGPRNVNGLFNYDINIAPGARGTIINGCRFDDFGAGGLNGACVAAGVALTDNTDGTIITGGCEFNMDMIVTPGLPGNPQPIGLSNTVRFFTLDYNTIEGNLARYGEGGVLPFNVLPVNMASILQPYASASILCIQAGTAVLEATVATAYFLRDPGFAGRSMLLTSEFPASGNTVTTATAGGFGGGHNTATFTALNGYAFIISITSTTWLVIQSSNVTFS